MKQWLVYKHTSLKSSKSYIGITSQGILTRWNSHVSEAERGSTRHFHRALRLYGTENWTHEVLVEGIDTLEEAYALEKYYIKLYNTFEEGYNLNEGGEGNSGLQLKEYFEKHIWEHEYLGEEIATAAEMINKYDLPIPTMRSYITSNGDSKSCKQVNGWIIKGRSKFPKQKISSSTIVTVYHNEYGKFHGTVAELSSITGKEIKHLAKLIVGKYKNVAGWRLTKEKVEVKTSNKIVYVYEDGLLTKEYESSFAASIALGLRREQMSEWLTKGKVKEINGKIYTYNKNIGVAR